MGRRFRVVDKAGKPVKVVAANSGLVELYIEEEGLGDYDDRPIEEAPTDGGLYARQEGKWIRLTPGTKD